MEFVNIVQTRRSVRKFKQDRISKETIDKIIQLASYSPSWKNTQTTRYIAIEDETMKSSIAENCVMGFEMNQNTINGAPCLVLVNTITSRSGFERDGSFSTSKGTHWESFDAGLATQTFCLAAHELGIGTVVLGVFDESKVIDLASVPEGQKVSAMISLGYPNETPEMPKRKTVEDLLIYKG